MVEVSAQTPSLQLDSTVVSARRRTAIMAAGAGTQTKVELARISVLPSILGNADPLHFVQLMPSMQSTSELDAGVHIQGCDHQHNLIALDGVPVYGASHLMGIFSVFNPTHYQSMTYGTIASSPGRLGGVLDMHVQRDIPKDVSFDSSLGLVSAQGTLKVPVGSRSALLLSGRKSFVNLLYGRFLTIDGTPLKYGFGDLNVSFISRLSKEDRISADLYYGDDSADAAYSKAEVDMDAYWNNTVAALHWDHARLRQTLWYSRYALNASVGIQNQDAGLPSHICSGGYKASWNKGGLGLGADFTMHEILPQDPRIPGRHYSGEDLLNAAEGNLSASWHGDIGYSLTYGLGLAGGWYFSPERKSFFTLSPEAELTWLMLRGGSIRLRGGVRHQNLFQTGLSNLGLPIEFWIPAGRYSDPQWSLYSSLAWNMDVSGGDARLSAELYCRRLGNQLEYTGGVMEFLQGTYSLDNSLASGSGLAYGVNLMAQKLTGRLTGWVGLAAGRSLREFDGKVYPSNHERLVEFNAVASYSLRRWDFGGSFLAAGGTPFTEAEEYYLYNGQLVGVFGEHNASRLRPYIRLDLNARLHLRDFRTAKQSLNFSVYNATMHKQEIYRYMHLNRENGTFKYGPMYLGLTILPSISYEISF